MRTIYGVALIASAQLANAAIVEDGIWTGNDWYDAANNIGVKNGVPYSNDPVRKRLLNSPMSYDGPLDDYMSHDNVKRVARLFTEDDWERGFPHANPLYSRQEFLKAVAKFPAFCDDNNLDRWSDDDVCKRELATIFAHWGQETGKRDPNSGEFWTQGLFYVEEINKSDYKSSNWSADAWPNQDGVQYFGRGPMQLSWNYNYGQFSNIFDDPSSYDSKMLLLKHPEMVSSHGFIAMAAGIWFYMTPQDPKPSMHDVMTGNFIPNAVDLQNNVTASFATTTNIINGALECGNNDSAKRLSRAQYFSKWLQFFDLPAETDLDCGTQPNQFPNNGASDISMYFDKDWSGSKCKLVSWMTQYSAAARDDYKRCVCDKHGKGEADCPTAQVDPQPQPEPEPQPDPEPQPNPEPEPQPEPQPEPKPSVDVWKTLASLKEIKERPHYSKDRNSNTIYHIDQMLSVIDKATMKLYWAAVDNELLD